MITRLRAWYGRLPNPVKAAVATAAVAFTGLFVPALVGWGNDVLTWVSDLGNGSGTAVPFPDPSVLTKAAAAGVAAAGIGLLNFVFRWVQSKGLLPGDGPAYDSTATGPRP